MKLVRTGLPVFLVLSACLAWAGDCRLILAGQSDYGNKLGFYLDLEAATTADGNCHMEGVSVNLAVSDGTTWHSRGVVLAWQFDRTHTVVATVAPAYSELAIDGVTVFHQDGGFKPLPGPVLVEQVPDWASSPAAYTAVQGDLTMSNSAATVTEPAIGARVPPEVLALSGTGRTVNFTTSSTDTQVFTTSFTLRQTAFPSIPTVPLIDRYGQSIQSTWNGKVRQDSDLPASDAVEAAWLSTLSPPCGYDAWGGLTTAGWRQTATGFYTIAKRNGYWWLITPQGNPLFYTGMSAAPALTWEMTPVSGRLGMFADLPAKTDPLYSAAWGHNVWNESGDNDYFAFIAANLIRKFGSDWQAKELALTERRIHAWGFSGLGKWSTNVGNLPLLPVLSSWTPTLVSGGHIDPFDARSQATFQTDIGSQVSSLKNDPKILGWSYQNEYQGIVTAAETQQILQLNSGTPAKRAMLDYAVNTLYQGSLSKLTASWQLTAPTQSALYLASPVPPAADLESLREYYENEIHKFIYQTFKQADPNHLYFGFWIAPGWWVNESDWRIAAANCDVLGYDRYAFNFLTPDLTALLAQIDKPSFIGEFSFPPTYDLARGFAVYPSANAEDEASAGDAYARWVSDAASEQTTVGLMWFMYRDDPLTGRGPGNGPLPVYSESYAMGAADSADRPKYELVSRMRDANLASGNRRLVLTDPHVGQPPRGRISPSGARPNSCRDRLPARADRD